MRASPQLVHGKVQPAFPFEATMAHEMIIDRALGEIEAQARYELVFDLFPDEQGIEFFGFHGGDPELELKSRRIQVLIGNSR
jgi:hypothetical protein